MHWRFTQVALRRYLRRTYDAKLAAQLGSSPMLEDLAAAHEVAKRHALATAEGPFETGPSGPVRTTGRTDRAARGLIERAAKPHGVDPDELREVRDREQARIRAAFLQAPAARTPADDEQRAAARRRA
ncbi:MAG: hypothetical protein Q8R60_15865 [Mycobacteriales bacterium]|nr:hypothetical protein [Mycobacteriales bacterium]